MCLEVEECSRPKTLHKQVENYNIDKGIKNAYYK
jgi:hypothetical protein